MQVQVLARHSRKFLFLINGGGGAGTSAKHVIVYAESINASSSHEALKKVRVVVGAGPHIGSWGYRSPYLAHAKRALYHLS